MERNITKPSKQMETFENPNPERDYVIRFHCPEFTCLCPKTGQPDFAELTLEYVPDRLCVELKSLKEYLLGFRSLGIFNENVVNRVLVDVVAAVRPRRMTVRGVFTPRGGIQTTVEARWPRSSRSSRRHP